MTEIIKDVVETDMIIDGKEWLVSEVMVELSLNTSPNYVDINKMVPHPDEDIEFTNPEELLGSDFRLDVDTGLISERDTAATEETLLFEGILGNISVLGDGAYEGVAYDPSQQPFELGRQTGEGAQDGQEQDTEQLTGGSLLNETIQITTPKYAYRFLNPATNPRGTRYKNRTIKASNAIEKVVDKLNLDDDKVDNQITDEGVTRGEGADSFTGAKDQNIQFDSTTPTIQEVLDRVTKLTNSTFWFDKRGVFHVGVPDPTKHELRFITETSDGYSTPPYQGIRVIGSGIASQEGFNRSHMQPEQRLVAEWVIVTNESRESLSAVPLEQVPLEELPEPIFTYRNYEISTQEQARNAAEKLGRQIAKQQGSGKVTVTGFPEVEPLDAVVMPQATNPDGQNYNPRQPMGGSGYGVYKVQHKLNSQDGFNTVIHVAGLTDVQRVVYTPDGPRGSGGELRGSPSVGVER